MPSTVFQGIVPAERVLEHAMLRDYTTMRVGGPADYLVEIASLEEIDGVLRAAKQAGIPHIIIGNGSNLLFSDAGFPGVVLHMGKAFSAVEHQENHIKAQCGALLSAAARAALDAGLSGMEFASGIPGSVGGAVYMNAGAYGGEISQILQKATVYQDGAVKEWSNGQLDFSYRHSALMDSNALVLSADFVLQPGDPQQIRALMNELNTRRREKQPLQYPSCGSFFKRPAGHFAGALIEQAGLKGYAIGDAQVSELHAGFIINRGHATVSQIVQLMHHVQETVYRQSGVELEPEVRLIGQFDS